MAARAVRQQSGSSCVRERKSFGIFISVVKRAVKDKTLAVDKVQGKLKMVNTETKHLDRNPL